MTPAQRSMKGYELYSWQAEGGWNYALVVGTNRIKTFDEITSPANTIKSVRELRSHLAQLAPGEEIVWITQMDPRLSLPPQPVIDEVEKACQELGLSLTIMPK